MTPTWVMAGAVFFAAVGGAQVGAFIGFWSALQILKPSMKVLMKEVERESYAELVDKLKAQKRTV